MGPYLYLIPLLPLLAGYGLAGAVFTLALILLGFEFTLVSTIPLVSELAPTARATSLSINSTGNQTGRVIGALVACRLAGGARTRNSQLPARL